MLTKEKEKIPELSYRIAEFERSDNGPITLDEENRSVSVVAATENPAIVMDWEKWELITEVLLMSGCKLPSSRQIPLLGEHYRFNQSIDNILGSCRELEVKGSKLMGRTFFSTCDEAEAPYTKVREGHLTDVSVGYNVISKVRLLKGESQIIDGKEFKGPMQVATIWAPRELTLCPIAADQITKIRSSAGSGEPGQPPAESAADNIPTNKYQGGSRTMDEEKEVQRLIQDALSKRDADHKTSLQRIFDRGAAVGKTELALRMHLEGRTDDEITDAIIKEVAKERGAPKDDGGSEAAGTQARKLDTIDDETFIRGITSPSLINL